jgi:hypothetical protein
MKVDFITDTMAIDFRGGGPLSKKDRDLTEVGEILLLDPNGNLIVRNEVEDAPIIAEIVDPSNETGLQTPGRLEGDGARASDRDRVNASRGTETPLRGLERAPQPNDSKKKAR